MRVSEREREREREREQKGSWSRDRFNDSGIHWSKSSSSHSMVVSHAQMSGNTLSIRILNTKSGRNIFKLQMFSTCLTIFVHVPVHAHIYVCVCVMIVYFSNNNMYKYLCHDCVF